MTETATSLEQAWLDAAVRPSTQRVIPITSQRFIPVDRLAAAIDWAGDAPQPAQLDDLHHQSHRLCYIANSVRAEVRIEPA